MSGHLNTAFNMATLHCNDRRPYRFRNCSMFHFLCATQYTDQLGVGGNKCTTDCRPKFLGMMHGPLERHASALVGSFIIHRQVERQADKRSVIHTAMMKPMNQILVDRRL